jgi:hypothetical protein
MAIPFIGDIISAVKDVVSEVVVDKDKRDELNYRLQELADKADERNFELQMGQIEINKVEAASTNWFVAGWRPFIGWVSGFGVAWTFVLAPFAEFVAKLAGWVGTMPTLDVGQLMVLVTSMLGLGVLRSYDKVKGTDITVQTQEGVGPVITKTAPSVTPEPPKKRKKFKLL